MLIIFICCASGAWADIQTGRQLYQSYGCALCHGPDGRGDGINGRQYKPPPTNFHDSSGYHHGLDRDSLRRAIAYGIKDENSIMPAFEDIPQVELNAIIDYLQSLQKQDNPIVLTDAWIMAVPPIERTSAAFMTIMNRSGKEMELVSVRCDLASVSELHIMSEANGMMRMGQVTGIKIPAHGEISLNPKGYHIMLINLNKPVKEGDSVALKLHFKDGTNVGVNAQVKSDDL